MDEEDKKLVMQLSAEDKSALSLSIVNRKVSLLQGNDFKDYINYKDIGQAIQDVVNNNNIKSGLQRNPHTGQLEKKPA